jgi:acetoin utilization deacetylase AcuC-like enzyme
MEQTVLPALDAFAPELILVSAGFDAHKADPLAQMELETEDFAWAGRELRALSLRHCQGRLVSTLEGGYDLPALAGSAAAYLEALEHE